MSDPLQIFLPSHRRVLHIIFKYIIRLVDQHGRCSVIMFHSASWFCLSLGFRSFLTSFSCEVPKPGFLAAMQEHWTWFAHAIFLGTNVRIYCIRTFHTYIRPVKLTVQEQDDVSDGNLACRCLIFRCLLATKIID